MSHISRQFILAFTLFTGGVAAAPSHAAIIANYTFDGNSAASSDADLGTTASDITFPGITNAVASTPLIDSNKIQIQGVDTVGDADLGSLAAAMSGIVARGNYFEFTVTIPSFIEVDLTSLSWSYFNNDGYDFTYAIFSNKTGIAANSQLYGYFDNNNDLGADIETFGTNPIVLSSNPSFQNLSDTTVSFRFYVGDSSTATTRIHEFDNIVLNAEVTAIPEPSMALLGGFVLLGFTCKRLTQRREATSLG